MALIQAKGYDYVCLSRSTKAEIKKAETGNPVIVNDRKNREITLEKVLTNKDSAYYLKVSSPTKALKERAMKTLFEQRFEDGLACIKASLTKKSGVKTYEIVLERIGRLKQKYVSVHSRYKIEIEKQTVPLSANNKSKIIVLFALVTYSSYQIHIAIIFSQQSCNSISLLLSHNLFKKRTYKKKFKQNEKEFIYLRSNFSQCIGCFYF